MKLIILISNSILIRDIINYSIIKICKICKISEILSSENLISDENFKLHHEKIG